MRRRRGSIVGYAALMLLCLSGCKTSGTPYERIGLPSTEFTPAPTPVETATPTPTPAATPTPPLAEAVQISLSAPSAASATTGPVTFTVTYAHAASISLSDADISLDKTGTADASVGVSGTGSTTRTVTLSSITGEGTLGITIAAGTALNADGVAALGTSVSATFDVILLPSTTSTGTGADGALTTALDTVVNVNTFIDQSAVAAGAQSLTVGSTAGFGVGDEVMILQGQSAAAPTHAGSYEFAKVASLTATEITLTYGLTHSYTSGSFETAASESAQVIRVPNYTSVNVPTGTAIVAPAWDGKSGGVVAFRSQGAVTIAGLVDASGKGFRSTRVFRGFSEDHTGISVYSLTSSHGYDSFPIDASTAFSNWGQTAGGGGHATAGLAPKSADGSRWTGGGGAAYGASVDWQRLLFGSPGGSTHFTFTPAVNSGGDGGGVVVISAQSLSVSGGIRARGVDGTGGAFSASGGGAGGTILIATKTATSLGSGLVSAMGGADSGYGYMSQGGGGGGDGRIFVLADPLSLTGTTTPASSP